MIAEPQPPVVPDIVLERYRLNELSRTEADRLERRLRSDETLRLRLEALDGSDDAIRLRYPADWLAARVRGRLGSNEAAANGRGSRWTVRWALPAALAVATSLLVFMVKDAGLPRGVDVLGGGDSEPSDVIKGQRPALTVFRKTAEGSEELTEGATARAGNLIRVGYRAAGRPFGVILSIDGRGGVTLHLPAAGGHAAPLGRNGTVLLEQAYELDDAPQIERFYLITSGTPFAVGPVVETARRAAEGSRGQPPASLGLPRGFEQSTLTLQKEAKS